MQSIFTKPLFINPQAYLTIPELALIHRSESFDFNSNEYLFQVITTGKIEGKLLKANDKYILHLDLITTDGNNVLGEFYIDSNNIPSTEDFVLEQKDGMVKMTFWNKEENEPEEN